MPDPEETLEALSAALADSVTEAKAARDRHLQAKEFATWILDQFRADGLDAWAVTVTPHAKTFDVEATFDDATAHLCITVAVPVHVVADPVTARAAAQSVAAHLRPTALETVEAARQRSLATGDSTAEMYWTRWADALRPARTSWQAEAMEAFADVDRERARRARQSDQRDEAGPPGG